MDCRRDEKGVIRLAYLRGTAEERRMARQAYARLEREGSARRVFCDGTVRGPEAFEADLFRPGSLPFLVFFDERPCGVTWMNTIEGRSARGHFALFRRFWGRHRSIAIGRAIFEHFLSLRDGGGYLFDVLLGLAPVGNPLAWKLALLCGAERVGVIPHGVYDASQGAAQDAVLTVTTRESLEKSRWDA